MPREKPTRYRATWEFELRFPHAYAYVREEFQEFTRKLEERCMALNSDYCAIEKIERKDG